MRRYNIGKNVEIDGTMKTNETVYDPFDPSDPSQVNDKYVDSSQAVILQTPTYIPERYVFRGWQLLDRTGAETGIYYAPGDEYTIDSTYADVHGVIHFEAAYEPEKETVRRVDVTSLVLDANSGYTVKKNLYVYEDYVYVDLDNNLVNFTKQVNNFDVKLHDYYDNFGHSDGYMLLGWDTDKQPENYIPRFAADAVVGVDSTDDNNTLYAIWEPMYYLNLQNYSTDYNITFNLKFTGYDGSTVYSGDTNTVVSTFEREVFSTLKDTSKNRINSNPENYKVGLLFEIAGKIESEGSEAVDYGSNDELRLKAINAVINNSNNKSGTIKAGGLPKFYYSQFDPSDLNDDNRLEYYRGIDNILNKDGSLNPNATYIFNVYAFMRLPDGTILQSEPVNLQMHNLAIKTITG